MNQPLKILVANKKATELIVSRVPVLTDLVLAKSALAISEGELGHAGPPFEPGQIPPPVVLNALVGAVLHEGWAGNREQAERMILDGEIRLHSNHSLGVVSPMAGVVRPSQPLFRVVDEVSGVCRYATLAEKGSRVLRFGTYGTDVAEGLRFVEIRIANALAKAIPDSGIPLLPLIARGVSVGDDVHQRNVGGMFSFLDALPALSADVRSWLATHPQHFLNYAMAAAKLCLDAAAGVADSTIVTAISRNGIDCGIQIAARPGRWFKAPASQPQGGWFAGRTEKDAHLDLGDSAIMEAFGLGGCIAHTSPEIATVMGQDWDESLIAGRSMQALFTSKHTWDAPALANADRLGLGLDAEKVVKGGQGVRIHTGIAHRDGISGWIGVGVANAPLACFIAALQDIETSQKCGATHA